MNRTTFLIDLRSPGRPEVEAFVEAGLAPTGLDLVEKDWGAARRDLAGRAAAFGLAPIEHGHWDWRNKRRAVAADLYSIVAIWTAEVSLVGATPLREFQGVMAVEKRPRVSQLGNGSVVYLDYVEVAPWNHPWFSPHRKYAAVGTALVSEAIRLSCDLGFGGRIGLHSLPQAEEFYASRCKMTRVGTDPTYHDLTYFEYTSKQALDWLAGTGGTLP
jgi:hypothetical protein